MTSRQVLVNACPGFMVVRSGTVTSIGLPAVIKLVQLAWEAAVTGFVFEMTAEVVITAVGVIS